MALASMPPSNQFGQFCIVGLSALQTLALEIDFLHEWQLWGMNEKLRLSSKVGFGPK